jgi:hypothetical protein
VNDEIEVQQDAEIQYCVCCYPVAGYALSSMTMCEKLISLCGDLRNAYKILVGKLEGRDHLEDQGINRILPVTLCL